MSSRLKEKDDLIRQLNRIAKWEIRFDADRRPVFYNSITRKSFECRPEVLDGEGRVTIREPKVEAQWRRSWLSALILKPDEDNPYSFMVSFMRAPAPVECSVHRSQIRCLKYDNPEAIPPRPRGKMKDPPSKFFAFEDGDVSPSPPPRRKRSNSGSSSPRGGRGRPKRRSLSPEEKRRSVTPKRRSPVRKRRSPSPHRRASPSPERKKSDRRRRSLSPKRDRSISPLSSVGGRGSTPSRGHRSGSPGRSVSSFRDRHNRDYIRN